MFAFGLVAFGFLGMGPVTIAVDSYGPVTDNAQSVYELSTIEQIPGIQAELKKNFGFDVNFERAKQNLEENDGAGNTFKATAKPVLIGTAVVGATTMIFSIIVALTQGLKPELVANLSLLHPPFLLGLITGGAMIYWFTGASTQAVTTGAYRAVEFIKANIKLEGATKASVDDSKKVVEICTQYAQKGMFNIFLSVFFGTLAFAFVEPFFFIGYLVSIALFGLYQAIFMANAGGAWDNAKKIVEVELKKKGTPLHDAGSPLMRDFTYDLRWLLRSTSPPSSPGRWSSSIEGCARAGISAIAPWRDMRGGLRHRNAPAQLICVRRHDGDLPIAAAACFRRPTAAGRKAAIEDNKRAIDEARRSARAAWCWSPAGSEVPGGLEGPRRCPSAGARRPRRTARMPAPPDAAGDRAAAPDVRRRSRLRQYAGSGARSL